ncbi:MAG: MFS transporter, partial [Actinomycetota bacterium]
MPRRWSALALGYLCALSFAFVFQSIPPVLSLIIKDLGISHAQAGALMSLFALPGIAISIPGGLLADFFGEKRTGLLALVLMILGVVLVASGKSFAILGLGRIVSGVGALTLSIVAARLISSWFAGRELGLAMGIFNTAVPLATIVSLNVFGILGKGFGWQIPILLTAGFGLVCLVIFFIFYKPASQSRARGDFSFFSSLAKLGSSIWIVGLVWMWFNAAAISFVTFGSDFFMSKNYSISVAGLLTSFLMWGAVFLSPLIGYLIDRFGGKRLLIGAGGILMAVALYLIPGVSTLLFLLLITLAILAVATAMVPVSVFSLPPDIVSSDNLGFGFGVLSTLLNVGVVVGPYVVGLARDKTGSYLLGFGLMSIFALFT